MSSRSRTLTSAVIAFFALLPGATSVSAANATGINVQLPATTRTTYSISGSVHKQSGGAAVSGATVQAFGANGSVTATSGASGTYTVMHLLPGTYHLYFQPPVSSNLIGGYLGGSSPHHYSATYPGVTVTVPTHNVTGKNIDLPSGHAIGGHITNSNGTTGIANATVLAYGAGVAQSTHTDGSGNYTVSDLPAGTFTVAVSAPYGSSLDSGCYWTGASPSHFSANCGSHTAVAISTSNRTGINIRLPAGLTVTGHVLDRSNHPIANAQVTTYPTSATAIDSDSVATGSDGKFVLHGVTPGSYTLTVAAPYGSMFLSGSYLASDKTNHWTRDSGSASTIHVTSNLQLSNIRPASGFSISGKITKTGGSGVASAFVFALDNQASVIASQFTDSNGNYTVGPVPSGTYRIEVLSPYLSPALESGYFRTDPPGNFTSSLSQATKFNVASNVIGKNVRLPVGASISGRVTVGGTGYMASVYATNTITHAIKAATVASNGNYTIKGLSAGKYIVQFFGTTMYPTPTTVKTIGGGYYKAGAPHNLTQDETQATAITVSP